MFSFHKPRVYRSTEGCCICRAKSSSSRFTDSKKYEGDSVKCFNLDKPRQGEICNACVLLVKRYKRLPVGSNRHWGHVVDARVGPGMKSMTKFKKLREENEKVDAKAQKSNLPEKFSKIFKKKRHLNKNDFAVVADNDCVSAYWGQDEQSLSPTSNQINISFEELQNKKFQKKVNRRKSLKPKKNLSLKNFSFIDENLWQVRKICCGFAYENSNINAIIIDLENYQPCPEHNTSIKIKCNILQKQNKSDNDTYVNKALSEQLTPGINGVLLKKHSLFLKRQAENYSLETEYGQKTDTEILSAQGLIKEKDPSATYKIAMMHKLKSDTGKIIKTSINKMNLSVRLTSNEIKDIKNSIDPANFKTVDVNKMTLNQTHNVPDPSASKFSDNSSDSGFDENMIDRKSASPLGDHADKDKKQDIRAAQKMYLANGIYVQGQKQNLMLTGNEVTTKILQRRLSHVNSQKF
ncbi:uncharacterized protein LOC129614356 [Condylostylus longicornis]|uniref:uncharacterized protein LOC129614356 n=1 Tax=Condylostylus longicornis TaxID=2530218 RepID=UPI00244E4ECF|nr:uncharacterized protein LOC129614356 [Condylostylus longicornis]XP_055384905.1 uncharacterized protein LOC129614356 [Condylostylus longicornis]